MAERCQMCSGTACNYCGRGCRSDGPEMCDHDLHERHADPMFGPPSIVACDDGRVLAPATVRRRGAISPPPPWRVEHDWTHEVYAADGTLVAKCSDPADARALVDFAGPGLTEAESTAADAALDALLLASQHADGETDG